MKYFDSKLRFKRGLFNLKSSMPEGKPPTAFIPLAKELAAGMLEIIKGEPFDMSTEALFVIPATVPIYEGAVIGADTAKGVVDVNQKVFGYENMYICDGSTVPANRGVNPSLNITVMSERAMSKIPEKKRFYNF